MSEPTAAELLTAIIAVRDDVRAMRDEINELRSELKAVQQDARVTALEHRGALAQLRLDMLETRSHPPRWATRPPT